MSHFLMLPIISTVTEFTENIQNQTIPTKGHPTWFKWKTDYLQFNSKLRRS